MFAVDTQWFSSNEGWSPVLTLQCARGIRRNIFAVDRYHTVVLPLATNIHPKSKHNTFNFGKKLTFTL